MARIHHWGAAVAAALIGATGAGHAQTLTGESAYAAPDYSAAPNWVCRPGDKPNACEIDLSTTVVASDGALTREAFKADAKAPIDCFYVYPTVSTDPGVLANMAVEAAEQRVVEQQLARFGAACRLYAPVYRQFTLTALAAAMGGKPMTPGGYRPMTPYLDVKAAWDWYLAHENNGRGVVLIGHSQGSGLLTALIKNEIDGKPIQKRMISAILMGTSLVVPEGKDVGGDFQATPLCHSAGQTGCVIAYASFRETSPPPPNTRFGRPRTPQPGMAAACVNPAALGGGEGELHAYLASGTQSIAPSAQGAPVWVAGKTVDTPFVSVPGMLTARCVSTPDFNYLSVAVHADPKGARTSELRGDVIVGGTILKDWGLHLIDANLAMGNLVDIVKSQGRSWLETNGK